MPELTIEQIRWINQLGWARNLYSKYFPHDSLCYSTEVFRKYLRFAKDQQLVLSPHLQFPEETDKEKELEFDIPKMLGEPPFLRLINENYLVDLQTKAKREVFNIFGYLVRKEFGDLICKEENRFHRFFIFIACKRKYRFKRIRIDTVVPELFFKYFDGKDNTSSYENGRYIWNFSGMLFHKSKSILEAYQRFAHKTYTLRRFGICRRLKRRNDKALKGHLYDYLKKNIPFCRTILSQSDNIFELKKGANPKLIRNERWKSKLRTAFGEMVDNLLETDIGKIGLYLPTDIKALFINIKAVSKKSILDLWESKIGLPDFKAGEIDGIRDKFNEIIPYLSSVNLSHKSRARFKRVIAPRAKKGKARIEDSGVFFERLDAMYELLLDQDSREFLNEPEIKKIFTPNFINELVNLLKRIPISLNALIDEADEDKGTIENLITSGAPDVSTPVLENEKNNEIKKIMEIVRVCTEKLFSNITDDEFVDKLVNFYDSFLRLRHDIPPEIWVNHLEGRPHSIEKMFKYYKNIDKIEVIHQPELKIFRKKILDILDIIDKSTRYYDKLYGYTDGELLNSDDINKNVQEIIHIINRKIIEAEEAKSKKLSRVCK
jgi:hypothetical protein